jgi:hypothetical protein
MFKTWLSPQRLERAARLLWGLVLLTLPVTTFRYIPGPLGRTTIKPLAFFPLALLLPVLILLFLNRRRFRLPANTPQLLAFLLFALAASLFAFLYAPIPLRGFDFSERVVRAWVSLFIGLVFFLVAFWMNRDEADLHHSLKWLYAGLIATLAWSLVQAVAVNTPLLARSAIDQLQLLFSDRGVQPRRITGFAYEPAWLADQIVIFYMPWALAALLARRPLTRYKWLEALLFLGLLFMLVFTYSRGGLLTGLVGIGVVLLIAGRVYLRKIWDWFAMPFRRSGAAGAIGLRSALVLLFVLVLLGAFSFLADYPYFANVWRAAQADSLVDYVLDISAGPRLAYATAGFAIYADYPMTGVGLGASGLYLFERYPAWAQTTPEIARQLSPDSSLFPNIKNLYIRLLAETGLPGFWLFIVLMLSFLGFVRRLYLSGQPFQRQAAIAGLFIWVSLALRNLTQDSLTFPIMWVSLGIIAGLASPDSTQRRET